MIAAAALILALWPTFALVTIAEILHGLTAGIISLAVAAVSLGLVGRQAMSGRTGRSHRFQGAGNAAARGCPPMTVHMRSRPRSSGEFLTGFAEVRIRAKAGTP
jgi:hypothetical protein